MVVVKAPDGTEFTELRAYRRHIAKQYFRFDNRAAESLAKYPGEIEGEEFQLTGLRGCTVVLCDKIERAVVSQLEDCKVFIGPTISTIALRDCSNCSFSMIGVEVRLTKCKDSQVRALTPGMVQLDDCHGITVGPINGGYSGLLRHMQQIGLDPTKMRQVPAVKDFSEREKDLPMPHYTMMSADQAASDQWNIEVPGALGPPEDPTKPDQPSNDPPAPANPLPDLNPSFEETNSAPESGSLVDDSGRVEDPPVQQQEQGVEEDDPFGAFDDGEDFGGDGGDFGKGGEDPFADSNPMDGDGDILDVAPAGGDEEADPFATAEDSATSTMMTTEDQTAPMPAVPPAAAPVFMADLGDSGVMQRVQAELEQRARQKDEESAKKQVSMREKAEEELDELYTERTNRTAVRSASNREAEKALVEHQQSDIGTWERVVSMIDTTKEGTKAEKDKGQDKSRMRSLLIHMKNSKNSQA